MLIHRAVVSEAGVTDADEDEVELSLVCADDDDSDDGGEVCWVV